MTTLRHVLAATDFSPPARHATERAARLAREGGARLTLMHAVPAAMLRDLRQWIGNASAQAVEEDARRHLGQAASDLEHLAGGTVQARFASGNVLDELGSAADELHADLVVAGARGAGFLRRLVLGSTSERLLRRSRRPVLIVRQQPHEAYRRVLVALDFSPWSMPLLALARQVAPHAELVLFSAFQVPFEEKLRFAGVDPATIDRYRTHASDQAIHEVHRLARDAGLEAGRWEPCVVEGDASERILEQEQERDADLVVLGKHGQSAAEDLLLGSVTKHVLAEGSVDVLVSTAATLPALPASP